VVVPNGDVHKCWDTVSMPEQRVGSVFDLSALASDKRALRWTDWSPFENAVCRSCKLLPNCAGSCAHKFVNSDQTRGEAAYLPCPSWKYNINEKLLVMAERSGAITSDDYDQDETRTDPRSLSPETHGEPSRTVSGGRRRLPLRVVSTGECCTGAVSG